MSKLRIIAAILMSAALLVGSMGAALAQDDEATPTPEPVARGETEYQGLFGTVGESSDIEGGIINLETKSRGEVEVLLNEDTIYKVPGQEGASKDDIEPGIRLAILATAGEDDNFVAIRVMVVPGVATRQHVNGVVVSVEDKVMTITNAAGETITVELPEGVKGGVVGEFVSVAVRNSPDKEKPVASGAQTAAEVQARIQTHLNEVAARRAETQAEIQLRERLTEQLSQKLEGLALRHREVLEGVLDKAPQAARESIQAAISNAEQGIEKAREAINRVRAALGEQQSGKPTTAPGQQNGN